MFSKEERKKKKERRRCLCIHELSVWWKCFCPSGSDQIIYSTIINVPLPLNLDSKRDFYIAEFEY